MTNTLLLLVFITAFVAGCRKSGDEFSATPVSSFKTYTIKKGEHYADQNTFSKVETSIVKFSVIFDSSAIYTTAAPENQYDINKLYGFSDNDASHHQYSARIGWRWSDNALRLFAYVYNTGLLISKEIASVEPGAEVSCSIVISTSHYIFKVNESTEIIPRQATTIKAKGYQLFPYFGGDEPAPHDISIRIKEEKQP